MFYTISHSFYVCYDDNHENYFKLLGDRHMTLFKNTAKKSPVVMICHDHSQVTANSDVSQQNVSSEIDLYVYNRVRVFR